jgi:very-short-patch-repair endonuclease
MTDAESIVWNALRNKGTGFKFVREKPFQFTHEEKNIQFIADFYCKECKVIVEIDGEIHNKQEKYDEIRSLFFSKEKDITCIRFTNDDVTNSIELVLDTIKKVCYSRISSDSPSPQAERGPGGEALSG